MSSPTPPNKRMYDDVKMHIPGLTDAVYKQMLYHVMNDFLSMTNIWQEEVPIAVAPPETTYPFTVSHAGSPMRLMLLYDAATAGPGKHWVQGGATMRKPGVIVVPVAPNQAATWNAVVSKTLDTVGSEGYFDMEPDDWWILDQYGDGVIYGILGRLMHMPSKPYTNAKLAGEYWQTYVAERGKARTDALHANVYGGQRWSFPQSFATPHRKGWV